MGVVVARWCVGVGGSGGPQTKALEVLTWPPMDCWLRVEALEVDVGLRTS